MALTACHVRAFREQDEPEVLALWARALPEWPVSAEFFRERTAGNRRLVAVAPGATVGYIAVARQGEVGQVTAVLVDPAHRRQGVGSELLAQAARALATRGVRDLSAGSGVGQYIWPGVPEAEPSGWAFFRARRFKRTGAVADLLADLEGFNTPAWVLRRVDEEVRFELACARDAAQVIRLQRQHFPYWTGIYERLLEVPGAVLVARLGERIVGSCIAQGPGEQDFIWGELIGGPLGEVGCVGVNPTVRGAGIGLAMVGQACELLAKRGAEKCYCAYTDLTDWYAKLGFERWRGYTMARAPVSQS